jgi:transcriptional regulator with XRE-family HTH domain
MTHMELVQQLEPAGDTSPLAAARLHKSLTVEEAARRAGLSPDEVEWLEAGRVYRFPSTDAAIVATLLYATGLGLDHREARIVAGLPVPPRPVEAARRGRLVVLVAVAAILGALVSAVVLPHGRTTAAQASAASQLAPPWKVAVDVLNGGGDINYTRRVASRIGALGYHIERVARADRFDYPRTAVYFEPGGETIGLRLARQLGVPLRPLPGGRNPNRLVLIVGPPNATGT